MRTMHPMGAYAPVAGLLGMHDGADKTSGVPTGRCALSEIARSPAQSSTWKSGRFKLWPPGTTRD